MIDEQDIRSLQNRLERARLLHLTGRLSEDVAWRLVRRTAGLLDRAVGSDYQDTLQVIYTLVESLWSNTRQQKALAELKTQVVGSKD
jgi:sirohydrochlorin ferrochelatase